MELKKNIKAKKLKIFSNKKNKSFNITSQICNQCHKTKII